MTSSNGNIFCVTGPLCREFTGLRWIPRTKASDAELWCFLRLNKRLSKQSWDWWFETLSRPLWRHCNEPDNNTGVRVNIRCILSLLPSAWNLTEDSIPDMPYLTYWGQDKMAAIFQKTFSNAFSGMKICEFRLRYHSSLFLRVQLTIFQHWFR